MSTTVTLPEQTLTLLDSPMPLKDAVKSLDTEGYFTADLAVPTETMLAGHDSKYGYDAFYDDLANRLSTGSDAYSVKYHVLGASPDGKTLYVRVSNNLLEYLRTDLEWAVEHGIDMSGFDLTESERLELEDYTPGS